MELILNNNLKDENDEIIKYEKGQLVTLNFVESDKIRTLTVRISEINKTEDKTRLEFVSTDTVNTNQRRSYFRLNTFNFKKKLEDTENTRTSVLDIGVKILPFSREATAVKAYKTELVNLSAGGLLSMFNEKTPPLNSLLTIRILIPDKGVIESIGRVARIEKSEKSPDKFLIGITFLEIKEEDREKILDFTYGSKEILQQTKTI